MKFLKNLIGWILIGAAGAFIAGFAIRCFVTPAPGPTGQISTDGPLMMGAKAAVTGSVIGFFIGVFGPRLYGEEPPREKGGTR
jgi:hypothetical protein